MTTRLRIPWLLLVLAAFGCGGEETIEGDGAARVTPPPPPPYETIPLDDAGRIEGRVTWQGDVPRDSIVPVADSLARICGGSALRLTPVRVTRGGVNGVIVWIADTRRGKALPAARRFELATDRCRLSPAVQPVIAGGMLNVLSLDRIVHRLQFTRPGTEGTVARVEQFDAGQVVPLSTVLSQPGPVTVRSDRFPWMEASIHVFDHPYFALTGDGGAFVVDSVPPGRYTLASWHPATGYRDTVVDVAAGDTSRVVVTIGGR